MVSVPVSGSSGLGSSPYRGHYYTLCSCTRRHLTLTEPFSVLECKWVPVNLLNAGGNPVMDKYPVKVGGGGGGV